MKILVAIAEAYPFAKVGGLADVGAGLSKALARRGHDVRMVLPGYRHLRPKEPSLVLTVPLGTSVHRVDIGQHGYHDGVGVWTAAPEGYFTDGAVYGYADHEVEPFILFGKAVVELAARWDWQPDIIHCHDWHSGLVPQYARHGPYHAQLERTGILLTIHNLSYQGRLGAAAETLAGLPGGETSLLARGIAHADMVTTVSRRYREEILAPGRGMGLGRVLRRRARDLFGIVNGID